MPQYTDKSAAALAGAARRKVGHCRAFLFKQVARSFAKSKILRFFYPQAPLGVFFCPFSHFRVKNNMPILSI